jgi:enterochelin esterase-like enzyme
MASNARPDDNGSGQDIAWARRLLLWYPRTWRARYGDEFGELLVAELAEQGPCWRRSANVAVSGLRARLAGAGLAGHPLDPWAAAKAGLAVVTTCGAAAGLAGAAMWAQLAIGLQWSAPPHDGIWLAMDLMSAGLLVLVMLALLAAAPVAWAAVAAAVRGHGRRFRWPFLLVAVGLVVLVIGGRHFQNGWPGTGGHLLMHQGLVPGGVAAFGWATTMWITSYWVHPAALATFQVTQVGWMLVSPAATGCALTGAVKLLRRVELSPRAFRYQAWVANLAWAGLAAFVSGALSWLVSAGGGSAPLFRVGAIDRAGFAILALAAIIGAVAARQAWAAGRSELVGPSPERDDAAASARVADGMTRRRIFGIGLGSVAGLAAAGAGGLELVAHGVLPGRSYLDLLDGACSVPAPPLTFSAPGPSVSGTFYSRARRREVGYTIAYPPGTRPGSRLPLVIALHAYGGDHSNALGSLGLAHALALRLDGQSLPPMAIAAADGGGGYWNPHPHDDPMGMVLGELIPRCQRIGLGLGRRQIGTLGISMGGYGAVLLAERYPDVFGAAAAISPAIWTSYEQARSVNPGAYASASAFAAADAVTHASSLKGVAVRVATGLEDPFRPGVEALARALPRGAVVRISRGCHSGPFFQAQLPPSLAFLARHLP